MQRQGRAADPGVGRHRRTAAPGQPAPATAPLPSNRRGVARRRRAPPRNRRPPASSRAAAAAARPSRHNCSSGVSQSPASAAPITATHSGRQRRSRFRSICFVDRERGAWPSARPARSSQVGVRRALVEAARFIGPPTRGGAYRAQVRFGPRAVAKERFDALLRGRCCELRRHRQRRCGGLQREGRGQQRNRRHGARRATDRGEQAAVVGVLQALVANSWSFSFVLVDRSPVKAVPSVSLLDPALHSIRQVCSSSRSAPGHAMDEQDAPVRDRTNGRCGRLTLRASARAGTEWRGAGVGADTAACRGRGARVACHRAATCAGH
jgi:hypothetical protein